MELESLRRVRRALSATVALTAVAWVMARSRGAAGSSASVLGLACLVSLGLLVLVWRKEHVAGEAAFAERARRQLGLMKLELELQKKRADKNGGR